MANLAPFIFQCGCVSASGFLILCPVGSSKFYFLTSGFYILALKANDSEQGLVPGRHLGTPVQVHPYMSSPLLPVCLFLGKAWDLWTLHGVLGVWPLSLRSTVEGNPFRCLTLKHPGSHILSLWEMWTISVFIIPITWNETNLLQSCLPSASPSSLLFITKPFEARVINPSFVDEKLLLWKMKWLSQVHMEKSRTERFARIHKCDNHYWVNEVSDL